MTDNDTQEQQVPISLVEGIIIFGRIQLSTDVIRACLKSQIPVFFLSKRGTFFGKLDSLEIKNVELLYTHIQATMDTTISLQYAKSIVLAKLSNSKVMLQRRNRFYHNGDKDIVSISSQIDGIIQKVSLCDNHESLRGLEWIGARYYFEWFALFVEKPFVFDGRNRRPPKDPVNSMLSLGYTLLAQTIQMILHIQWLDVQLWFLHTPKDLKTLLVLDMMEMYRAWIVDDLVMRVIKNKKINIDHFWTDEENDQRPVLFTDDGLKIFIQTYYDTIFKQRGSSEVVYENDFIKIKIIEKNIEIFKQSLVKKTYDYEGFKIK
jgi:CRISPR-associated protein Cas1